MYIVAIAWLYVVVLMAFTESSVTAAVLTLVFYGLVPCALLAWLFGGRGRKRAKQRQASAADSLPDNTVPEDNRADPQPDQRKLRQ